MKKIMFISVIAFCIMVLSNHTIFAQGMPVIANYNNGTINWVLDEQDLADELWDSHQLVLDGIDILYEPTGSSFFKISTHNMDGDRKNTFIKVNSVANTSTGYIDFSIVEEEPIPGAQKVVTLHNCLSDSELCYGCDWDEDLQRCPCYGDPCSFTSHQELVDTYSWYDITTLVIKIAAVVAVFISI